MTRLIYPGQNNTLLAYHWQGFFTWAKCKLASANGLVGSWNRTTFASLFVNSAFIASAVLLLFFIIADIKRLRKPRLFSALAREIFVTFSVLTTTSWVLWEYRKPELTAAPWPLVGMLALSGMGIVIILQLIIVQRRWAFVEDSNGYPYRKLV